MDKARFQHLLSQEIHQMCNIALIEDLAGEGGHDITAELIAEDKQATATLITRENGILCGQAWLEKTFELLGGEVAIQWYKQDGDRLKAGDTTCELKGNARKLLTGERTAMNFLQTLSATATQAQEYAIKLKGTHCKLLDTRKTIPGMRFGQKYAVSCGGGSNHRLGLSDAFLIKENHIMSCGGISQALQTAIKNHPDKLLEIEVESIEEFKEALDGKAQVIMLDNFTLENMQNAVQLRNNHTNQAKLEASGNVSLETISDIAQTGVDLISVGAITKHIKALDLSLRVSLSN